MLVVKDLMPAWTSLELNDENRLDARAFAGGGASVNALDGYAFRKEIELGHELRSAKFDERKVFQSRYFCAFTL